MRIVYAEIGNSKLQPKCTGGNIFYKFKYLRAMVICCIPGCDAYFDKFIIFPACCGPCFNAASNTFTASVMVS